MIFTQNVLHQDDKSDLSGKMDEKHKKMHSIRQIQITDFFAIE